MEELLGRLWKALNLNDPVGESLLNYLLNKPTVSQTLFKFTFFHGVINFDENVLCTIHF